MSSNAEDYIVQKNDRVLVTGANGFVGPKVVETLLGYGFSNLRCLVRQDQVSRSLKRSIEASNGAEIEILKGNLLSPSDCASAVKDVKLVYHLAASTGEKSLTAAYRNSVEATSRLLEAIRDDKSLRRIVNVSSFSVYSNVRLAPGAMLDESCPLETRPELRGEAYSFAKIKQEEAVREFVERYGVRCVTVRPGVVFGPGSVTIPGRVGILSHGMLFNLGGENRIPFTYVDNCAEAIVLAGIVAGLEGEAINIVDDGQITSNQFVQMYKASVGSMRSIGVPHVVSRFLFSMLGLISSVAGRSVLAKYNRLRWSTYWKGNSYTNGKAKVLLGWTPRVPIEEAMQRYFEFCRASRGRDA